MSAHRLAPLAACLGALVALAGASSAGAGTTGLTIRIVNQTGDVLGNGAAGTVFGSFSVTPPITLTTTSPGNTGTAVAALDSQGRFLGAIQYGPQSVPFDIQADGGPQDPFGVNCTSQNQLWTCSVQNATTTTPWVVNLRANASDRTPPALRVRAPASLTVESLREAGLRVGVRSNEPGRARIKLIARGGARHAAAARTLRWAGRNYPVALRLNAAGRRAVQVFDVYKLRIRVGDRAGNHRTVQRRIVIR
jgi:hypothetical protein